MLEVLSITFPIFAAIGIGYATVRAGVFSPADMRVLGKFVINVAFPALALHAVASRDFGQVIHGGYLLVLTVAGLLTLGIGYGLAAAAGTGPARRAVASMGMALPNSAYVGYPIMLLTFPDIAGQILALNFLVENFLLLPIGLTLLEMSRPQSGRGILRVAGDAVASLLKKPFMIGLLAGLLISALDLPYPAPVGRLAALVAGSASAVALIVVGGTLVGLPLRGDRGLAAAIAAGKLLLHPAMMVLALAVLPALGMAPLPPELHAAAILSAAMPMIAIFVVLSQPYGYDGLASISLLVATAASFVTITVVMGLLL